MIAGGLHRPYASFATSGITVGVLERDGGGVLLPYDHQ